MARVGSQRLGNLSSAIPLQIAQGQHVTLAFGQKTQQPLHAQRGLRYRLLLALWRSSKLPLELAQRLRLVLAPCLPVIRNRGTRLRAKPAHPVLNDLVIAEP